MQTSKILVVDDDAQMRTAITEALTRSGYPVDSYDHAQDASDAMVSNHYSLVITDVRMPGMSGLDLLKNIKETHPTIPVVVMTAFGTIQDAVAAMKEGAYDYILKPFSLEDIEAIVIKALDRRKQEHGKWPQGVERRKGKSAKEFITQDSDMLKILDFIREVARGRSTVLIQGESGTGKELVARMIHQNSPFAHSPFVAVNCAAIPEGLLESELFGHEKGAFSGAVGRKIGKFERANGGTLLLDEVGEMDLVLQAKLLRVLQEEEIERLGGTSAIPIHVRIIATTNRELREEVNDGRFREDLYYRLNVIPVLIPPLRARRSDIRHLTEFFVKRYALQMGKEIRSITNEVYASLEALSFPGNVRELENLIERAVLLCQRHALDEGDLAVPHGDLTAGKKKKGSKGKLSVHDMEQDLILETLRKVHGNRTKASKMLGISIRTLRNKLAEYRKEGIDVPPYEPGGNPKKEKNIIGCT